MLKLYNYFLFKKKKKIVNIVIIINIITINLN